MGKRSKERRRLQRALKFQPSLLNNFKDLGTYVQDRANAVTKPSITGKLYSISGRNQPGDSFLNKISSGNGSTKSMDTGRIRSLTRTIFKGKNTAMTLESRKKRPRLPLLGMLILGLMFVGAYYGYHRFMGHIEPNISRYQSSGESYTTLPRSNPVAETTHSQNSGDKFDLFSTGKKLTQILSDKKTVKATKATPKKTVRGYHKSKKGQALTKKTSKHKSHIKKASHSKAKKQIMKRKLAKKKSTGLKKGRK